MNALIENTLSIIAKISDSKKGYLLQLTDQGYNILNVWGGEVKDFSSLNNSLY